MGISESCRPFIIHLPDLFFACFVLICVEFVMFFVLSVFCNEFLILLFIKFLT